ncbi:MAG: 2OG-Fe(II) oxygenase, partial [Gemmatimonadaceae bacterium]
MIAASAVTPKYREQDEFLFVENFIDVEQLARLIAEANEARPLINRNYVPRIKKGGSVSYFDVAKHAPSIHALYQSPELISWLSEVTGEKLLTCPATDPHACALYYYTEAGDHIG